jgi:hypothetical protein
MTTIVLSTKGAKLMKLCEAKGYARVEDLLRLRTAQSTCPAICLTEGCDFIGSTQPDEQEGQCEACGGSTMISALVLAGITQE